MWPLHGVSASRAIERRATESLPDHTLMRRAGIALYRLAIAIAPHASRFWVAAGPGNNGGDGLEVATVLHGMGRSVSVTLLGDPTCFPADAAQAWQRAQQAGVQIDAGPTRIPDLGADDLAIDALLGLGTSRPPQGPLAEIIARLSSTPASVLSVDLPSGLDADSGWLDRPDDITRCVRADHTLSLLTLKPGLFTAHGRDHAGQIWLCPLGSDLGSEPADAYLSDGSIRLPSRSHAHHKGSFGKVFVIGGAMQMGGAAVLAARAALHAGAGRVYLQLLEAGPGGDLPSYDPVAPELMLCRHVDLSARDPEDVIVLGCGGGTAVGSALESALLSPARLVLDADALNLIAADVCLQERLQARTRLGRDAVLTPHPLEAARLLQTDVATVQASRLEQARALAAQLQCVVVLKGSGTIIASATHPATINPTGNALLGTAGTGDVLAGWVGALWAQGLGARQAAERAVWEHGQQADLWARTHPDRLLTAGQLLAT